MATPVTYEGMLDDMFRIDCGFARVGDEIGVSALLTHLCLQQHSN